MNKTLLLIASLLVLASCNKPKPLAEAEPTVIVEPKEVPADNRIEVLNFDTFHFGYTTDGTSVEFDQHSDQNRIRATAIAKELARFKPTVLVVETSPAKDSLLLEEYRAHLKNPDTIYKHPWELQLLAFELGRYAGTERIYGIDTKLSYNWNIGNEMADNQVDQATYLSYSTDPVKHHPGLEPERDDMTLKERLYMANQPEFLDVMINMNADVLTLVGSKDDYEGADEAAKYYQRNLRMFTNLNRIPLRPDDRVFILSGASHTAFFRDFLHRSPKFKMVDTFDYLEKE